MTIRDLRLDLFQDRVTYKEQNKIKIQPYTATFDDGNYLGQFVYSCRHLRMLVECLLKNM